MCHRRGYLFVLLPTCVLAISQLPQARAWDEEGHVIVTRVAYERLPPEMPDWLRSEKVRARLEYLSSEPDRWRGQHNIHLDHDNNPDHYIDAEDLEPFGLTLKTLPPLRREFLDLLATKRARGEVKESPRNARKDKEYTQLVPGMLPYEIAELQWKLAASWTTLKTYEQYRSSVTDDMIDNARQNVIYQMGVISHFVGDGSQPLHITRHHHGWVGPNPKGYTMAGSFHAYIDGGVIALHRITKESLIPKARPPRPVSTKNYWPEICGYLDESFQKLEPLYELEKTGDLDNSAGKAFIEDRLLEGGAMLAGVWVAAYEGAHIDEYRVRHLTRKNPTTQKN
jgi:hypothetical protein